MLAEEFARARQPGHVRAHLAMQRADVDAEIARPVFDAIPVERAAALGETARDFRVRGMQVQRVRQPRSAAAPGRARCGCRRPGRAACRRDPGRPCRCPTSRAVECGCGRHAARIIRTLEWMQTPKPWSISTRTAIFPMACWRRRSWWNARGPAGVGTLALTDHDTTAGLGRGARRLRGRRHALRPGVELSAQLARPNYSHRRTADRRSSTPGLQAHLAQRARAPPRAPKGNRRTAGKTRAPARPRTGGDRRRRSPLPRACTWRGCWSARGFARDTQEAFDRWLNRDTPGHVPAEWPSAGRGDDGTARQRRRRGAGASASLPRLGRAVARTHGRVRQTRAARRSRPAWLA